MVIRPRLALQYSGKYWYAYSGGRERSGLSKHHQSWLLLNRNPLYPHGLSEEVDWSMDSMKVT
jgi:hypothetical protein